MSTAVNPESDQTASSPTSTPSSSSAAPGGRRSRLPRWAKLVVLAVLLVLLISLPFWMSGYAVSIMSRALAFALLVVSVDLLTGYTGLPTLGQVAYFGAGAYAAGLVGVHWTSNAFVQVIVGTLVAALLALITGVVAVRTKGFVFLMVTLAITELAHQQAIAMDLIGGSNGLSLPPVTVLPGGEPLVLAGFVYFWVLFVFVVGVILAVVLVKSPMGRSMRGIRDGEVRMRAIGRRTFVVKLVAYAFAGSLAGMAGTAWAASQRFVSPGDMAFSLAAIALLAAVFGGAGTIWGPIVAAIIVIIIRDHIGPFAAGMGGTILGVVFVLAVFLLPKGIAGLASRRNRGTPTGPAVAGEES